jgi:hypothetical protein
MNTSDEEVVDGRYQEIEMASITLICINSRATLFLGKNGKVLRNR